MKAPLRVEKIGGTSMSRFPEIIDNIILRNPDDIYGRIYVVSAYGGITNELLEHKKTGQPGIYQLFRDQENYPKKMLALRDLFLQGDLNPLVIGVSPNVGHTLLALFLRESARLMPSDNSSRRRAFATVARALPIRFETSSCVRPASRIRSR